MTTEQPHPLLQLTAAHAERVMAQVAAGATDHYSAMAALIADVLAVSVEDSTPPEVGDQLLEMATVWATTRYRGLLAEAALRRDGVPDDPSGLDQ